VSVASQHDNDTLNFGAAAKIPITQWVSFTALIVTLAFNLSSRFSISDHTAADVAKLQADVSEMRKQVANRDDVREMQKVVERLEIQVATLSDRMERQK